MKVIAFNGSPHPDGVVAAGINIVAKELESQGIAVEIVQAGMNTQGCVDCRKCRDVGRCVFDKDKVNLYRDLLAAADGVVLGSPVYYGGIAGNFKGFLDRLFFPGVKLHYKVGALVVSLRRTGGIAAFHQLCNYFTLSGVILSPGIYWDVIHGNSAEEFSEDEEGSQIMEVQGRNMAWLMKALAVGKKDVPLPPPLQERKRTNFIH
jgi:multimeric flavodoxin WrbA